MKVYVINLAKNIDRLRLIDSRLKNLGVSYDRIEAVCGRELSTAEKLRSVSRLKWWCARGVLPRDGEIGCALSHLNVYRKLVESDDPCCCVLEDDDQFEPCFKEQLTRIEKWIDGDKPQVVLMTNYTQEDGGDEWKIVSTSGDSSTEAYVITKAAAKSLLKHNCPACMPSDGWRYWVKRGWIQLYHAFPTMVPSTWQLEGYRSDVCPQGEKMIRVSDMGVGQRIVWKFMRLIGLCLGKIIIK